jgi:hypothetical protein
MAVGDAVVAERLDAARTGARETVNDPAAASEWARGGHDGRIAGRIEVDRRDAQVR